MSLFMLLILYTIVHITYSQVTPLTSLKFAELVVKAGFPPGVVNILPGSGMLNTPVLCTWSFSH